MLPQLQELQTNWLLSFIQIHSIILVQHVQGSKWTYWKTILDSIPFWKSKISVSKSKYYAKVLFRGCLWTVQFMPWQHISVSNVTGIVALWLSESWGTHWAIKNKSTFSVKVDTSNWASSSKLWKFKLTYIAQLERAGNVDCDALFIDVYLHTNCGKKNRNVVLYVFCTSRKEMQKVP